MSWREPEPAERLTLKNWSNLIHFIGNNLTGFDVSDYASRCNRGRVRKTVNFTKHPASQLQLSVNAKHTRPKD